MICKIPGVHEGGIMTWMKRFTVAVAAAAAAGGLGLTSAASASTAHPAAAATPSQAVHQARPDRNVPVRSDFPDRAACAAYGTAHSAELGSNLFCEKNPGASVTTYTLWRVEP
jgi:hypothetical protein